GHRRVRGLVRRPQRRRADQRRPSRRTASRTRSVAAVPVFVRYRDVPAPAHARTQNSTRGTAVPRAVRLRPATSGDSATGRRQDRTRSVVRGAHSGRRQLVRRVPQGIGARGADMKRQKWSDIKARIKPATRARIEAEGRRLSDDLHLSQLRKARGLTQETMAELLGVSQAEVSKMERRTELYVGTLRKFIEAMNGELVIAARFADGVEVPIRLSAEEDAA